MLHWSRQTDALKTSVQTRGSASTTEPTNNGHSKRRKSSGLKTLLHSASVKSDLHQPQSQQTWEANYLHNLRTQRPTRPVGSRPLPHPRKPLAQPLLDSEVGRSLGSSEHTLPIITAQDGLKAPHLPPTTIQAQNESITGANASTDVELSYRDYGLRWVEKQEARSLRQALEDMDMEAEARIHTAAQKEASEIIQNHLEDRRDPQPLTIRKKYTSHLEKGAHQRSASSGWFQAPNKWNEIHASSQRSISNESKSSRETGHDQNLKQAYSDSVTYQPVSQADYRMSEQKASNHTGPFKNPQDRIFEESQKYEITNFASDQRIPSNPLSVKSRNAVNSNTVARNANLNHLIDKFTKTQSSPVGKQLPTRSFDPAYTTSTAIHNEAHGLEPRSEDIRTVTTMLRKDRSRALPMPTAVSSKPGTHIVSFDPEWRPDSNQIASFEAGQSSDRQVHVVTSEKTEQHSSNVPIITALGADQKIHANRNKGFASSRSTAQQSPVRNRATAQCAACGLSISGCVVSAAASRFHPQCFKCYHCAEKLECVAFYPEPDSTRSQRLAEYRKTQSNDELTTSAGPYAAYSEEEALRFFCHLDYHELFSPRCHSCKTPIEKEVVVACGNSWHVGHFFCAECGDPFDEKTPYVEKDGFAWCVSCHTSKFSGKCKGCRKPIVDRVISAMEAEWHEKCFVCKECGCTFDDGSFFPSEDGLFPRCVSCEERRLKA